MDEARVGRRGVLELDVRAGGRGVAKELFEDGRDLVRLLAGRETDGHVRLRRHRQHRLLQERLPACDPVHIH